MARKNKPNGTADPVRLRHHKATGQGYVSNIYRGTFAGGQAWSYDESCFDASLAGIYPPKAAAMGGLVPLPAKNWDYAKARHLLVRAGFGGTPQEKPEQYKMSSPITYAENVQAPVLIIQGRNDTRTPARPIEVFEQKMKSLGKEIEVVWFDAGHMGPFAQVEQAIKNQELMMKFATRVLDELGERGK